MGSDPKNLGGVLPLQKAATDFADVTDDSLRGQCILPASIA